MSQQTGSSLSKRTCPPAPVLADEGRNCWDVQGYKRQLQRIGDYGNMCMNWATVIEDFAKMHEGYAAELRRFAKERRVWMRDACPEIGTMRSAVFSVIEFAEGLAAAYERIAKELVDDARGETMALKQNCSVQRINETEYRFVEVEKEFKKRNQKVDASKNAYHSACRAEERALKSLTNAKTEVEKKKTKTNYAKAQSSVQETENTYRQALANLQELETDYRREMVLSFKYVQQLDAERIKSFQTILKKTAELIDVGANKNYYEAWTRFGEVLKCIDADADMEFWRLCGPGRPICWPEFLEYDSELSKTKKVSITK